MRRANIAVVAFAASALLAPLVLGQGVIETFNQHAVDDQVTQGPQDTNWWWIADSGYVDNTYIGDSDSDVGEVAPAAALTISAAGGFDNTQADTVYFETWALDNTITPTSFTAAFAFVPVPGAGVTVTDVVDSIQYYFLVDTDANPLDFERYYLGPEMELRTSPGYMQWYDTVQLGDAVWDRYDWNGAGFDLTSGVAVDTTGMLALGAQFNLNAFDGTDNGSGYMAIWVDNVIVPEPSALILACLGVVGLLARRQRRQAA
jgi:hypothetical protein